MTKTVLVTGGAGYIGSTIAHILVKSGFKVAIIDSLDKGSIKNTPTDADFYDARISNKDIYTRIKMEIGKIDVTIHCASYISVPNPNETPSNTSPTMFPNLSSCLKILPSSTVNA